MIRDGQIVYGAAVLPLYWWEFENTTLNALVIASLCTVLSYQVAASLPDILLGFKTKGTARVSDLHILLLTQQSSPLAVATNLLRNNWMTRRYFLRQIPRASKVIREESKVKFKVCAKLLILLAVAPVANIGAVILTLENEKTLTFKDLSFGGLALGVNTDLSVVESEVYSPRCRRSQLQTVLGEDPSVSFFICYSPTWFLTTPTAHARVEISVISQMDMYSAIYVGNEASVQLYAGTLATKDTKDTQCFIKHALTYRSISRLADAAVGLLADELGIENPLVNEAVVGSEGSFGNNSLTVSKSITYTALNNFSRITNRVNSKLSKFVTFVDSPSLEIIGYIISRPELQHNFTTADNLPLLTRRRRNVSLPLIAIVTLCAVLIRVAVKILCNNDLSDGLEQVIREQTNIEGHESVFQGRKVCYNKKYQHGMCAQYGLVRDDMPEVDEFVGAYIGLKPD